MINGDRIRLTHLFSVHIRQCTNLYFIKIDLFEKYNSIFVSNRTLILNIDTKLLTLSKQIDMKQNNF